MKPNAPGGGARTLNRDFKGVRRHAHAGAGPGFGAWAGFGAGLAVGLAIALGVHLHYRHQLATNAEPVPAPAQAPASEVAPDEAAVASSGETAPEAPEFDFYDMLPRQEVEVPSATDVARDPATRTPLPTGDAVLQAGSFKQSTEAEKMVARLALHGVTAKIQRASVDDETWYRVRIGPIGTVEELRLVQAKLNEAEVAATPVTTLEEAPLP